MVSPFEIYVIMQLDELIGVACGIATILLVVIVLCCLRWLVLYDQLDAYSKDTRTVAQASIRTMKKYIRRCVIPIACAALVVVIVPSTKNAIVILTAPHVLNNEDVQNIPSEFLRYLRHNLNIEEKKQ